MILEYIHKGVNDEKEIIPADEKVEVAVAAQLKFITNLPQKTFAPGNTLFIFDAFGREAINHANDPPPLFCFGNDDLRRIGGGTKDAAYLGHWFDGLQNIDGKETFSKEEDEAVPGANS